MAFPIFEILIVLFGIIITGGVLYIIFPKERKVEIGTASKGLDAADGADGNPGTPGEDGRIGINGEDGPRGVDGDNASDGTDGVDGPDGSSGTQGERGDQPDAVHGKDEIPGESFVYTRKKLFRNPSDPVDSRYDRGPVVAYIRDKNTDEIVAFNIKPPSIII